MGTQMVDNNILAFIENEVIPLHEVINAIKIVKNEAVEKINPFIITHASSLNSLQMESSSVDFIISMGTSQDFPGDNLVGEFSRVLNPGGEIFIHQTFDAAKNNTTSSLGRKLLVAGFSSIEVVQMAEVLSEGIQSFGIKGKKPSWKILPKVEVVEEMDVIDEDSLLSEEDLKKSQLPSSGDYEVGSTPKIVCGLGNAFHQNIRLTSSNTPSPKNISPLNSSQPPRHLKFETIRFPTNIACDPTKTSQNQFQESQLQSSNDDDTRILELSQPVKSSKRKISEKTRNPARTGPAPAQTWSTAEEAALVTAWIDISDEVGAHGNYVGPFWNRILKHFYNAMDRYDYRTHHQLNSKFRDINRKVMKFNDIYKNLLNERGSDDSEADILKAALEQYRSEHNAVAFCYGSAWDALKKSRKWLTVYGKENTSDPKRTKTSDSNDYTTLSDTHGHVDLDDEDDPLLPLSLPVSVPEPSRPVKSSKNIVNNVGVGNAPSNGQAWTAVEEAALATAWIDISEEDASTGSAQTVGPFWKRVLKHFHNAMGRDDYRTNHQLSSKWRDVNQKVAKFNDIYNNLLIRNGDSEADILRVALDEYRSENNGATFNHGSAWDVLKKSKKWVMASVVDHTHGPKRTKTSDSNDYTTSSDACCHVDVTDEDGEIEPQDDEIEPEEPRRQIGRGKGNRASSSTLSGSSMDEKIDRLADKLDKFTSTYDQHLELEKEKIRIKEKAREEKVRAKSEAREVEDFKILTAKVDHLTGPSLRAALALKEKIAKRYGFE